MNPRNKLLPQEELSRRIRRGMALKGGRGGRPMRKKNLRKKLFNQVIQMREKRHSIRDIAYTLGLTPTTVANWIRRESYKRNSPKTRAYSFDPAIYWQKHFADENYK